MGELFDYYRGKEKSPNQVPEGNTNFVKETQYNNGIIENRNPSVVYNGNKITVSVNNAQVVFYQADSFGASVNIMILDNPNLNPYNGLFLSSILSHLHKFKYDYNCKISKDKLLKERIIIPIDDAGEPDWDYMTNFMRDVVEQERSRLKEIK